MSTRKSPATTSSKSPATTSSKSAGKKRASDALTLDYDTIQDDDAYNHLLCPVCMDIAAKPSELPCGHTFCTDCLKTHLGNCSEGARSCPVCRSDVPEGVSGKQASDIAERRGIRVRCACGREDTLMQIRRHTDDCPTLRGVGSKAAKKAAVRAAKDNPAPEAANRSTFSCPFCATSNLPRADLLRHLEQEHRDQAGRPGVCPVCASMPWGDANYRSPHLMQHMRMRHQFDYAETADYSRSEDEILAEVLRASVADC